MGGGAIVDAILTILSIYIERRRIQDEGRLLEFKCGDLVCLKRRKRGD